MPWKATCAMDERMRFVSACVENELSMTELCRQFGISRETGYKWLHRYEAVGFAGLTEQSRSPSTHPNATAESVLDALREIRAQRPTYGPKKLLIVFRRRHPKMLAPAPSTVGAFLKREGLVVPRRRVRRVVGQHGMLTLPEECNAGWATDFKGQFRLGDRRYCYPLTLQDSFSRFLLRCQALARPTFESVRPVYEAAFREFGLPDAIRSDNGPPFASATFSGLTKISAWWLTLGIRLERIRPGCPQENGRLERFHRTLKQETALPPRRSLRAQQNAFAAFTTEYNEHRPHEALGQKTPASVYTTSRRSFPAKPPEPQYPGHWDLRRVDTNGQLLFGGYRLNISKALIGHRIALEEIADDRWRLHFFNMTLGVFDKPTGMVTAPGYCRTCKRG